MAKSVKFVKNKDGKVFFSEWYIYLDGKYDGFIYKCKKKGTWSIVSNRFQIFATIPISEQKTLADAKRVIQNLWRNQDDKIV